ncbi:MAG: hypothetical protein M0C28_40650 [Candidatus Moduliflexus flocculans]|nr:hypothetical protein [Candidatus Moduliflexus flocculans]
MPAAGGTAVNLTGNGRKDGDPLPRDRCGSTPTKKGIDLSKPRYVSAFGEWTKKGGYAKLEPGKPGVADAAVGRRGVRAAEGEEGGRLRLHEVAPTRTRPTTT